MFMEMSFSSGYSAYAKVIEGYVLQQSTTV